MDAPVSLRDHHFLVTALGWLWDSSIGSAHLPKRSAAVLVVTGRRMTTSGEAEGSRLLRPFSGAE